MTDRRRINGGYVITCAVPVGEKEFVLGVSRTASTQFVTWQCKDGTDYIWGHYMDSPLRALRDLCGRVMEEVEYLEIMEQEASESSQSKSRNSKNAESGSIHRQSDRKEER